MSLEILQKLEQERYKWLANYALYEASFCEVEMNRAELTVKVNNTSSLSALISPLI